MFLPNTRSEFITQCTLLQWSCVTEMAIKSWCPASTSTAASEILVWGRSNGPQCLFRFLRAQVFLSHRPGHTFVFLFFFFLHPVNLFILTNCFIFYTYVFLRQESKKNCDRLPNKPNTYTGLKDKQTTYFFHFPSLPGWFDKPLS